MKGLVRTMTQAVMVLLSALLLVYAAGYPGDYFREYSSDINGNMLETKTYPPGAKIETDKKSGSIKVTFPSGKVMIITSDPVKNRTIELINCNVDKNGALIEETATEYVYAPSGLTYEVDVNRNRSKKGRDGSSIPVIRRDTVVKKIELLEKLESKVSSEKTDSEGVNPVINQIEVLSTWLIDHSMRIRIKGYSDSNKVLGIEVARSLVRSLSSGKTLDEQGLGEKAISGISSGVVFTIDQSGGRVEAVVSTLKGDVRYVLLNGSRVETDSDTGISKVFYFDGKVEVTKTENDSKNGITRISFPDRSIKVIKRDVNTEKTLEILNYSADKYGKIGERTAVCYVYGSSGFIYEIEVNRDASKGSVFHREQLVEKIGILEDGINKYLTEKSVKTNKNQIVNGSEWFALNVKSIKAYGFTRDNKVLGQKIVSELTFIPAKVSGGWDFRDNVIECVTGATDVTFSISYIEKGYGKAEVGSDVLSYVAGFYESKKQ